MLYNSFSNSIPRQQGVCPKKLQSQRGVWANTYVAATTKNVVDTVWISLPFLWRSTNQSVVHVDRKKRFCSDCKAKNLYFFWRKISYAAAPAESKALISTRQTPAGAPLRLPLSWRWRWIRCNLKESVIWLIFESVRLAEKTGQIWGTAAANKHQQSSNQLSSLVVSSILSSC